MSLAGKPVVQVGFQALTRGVDSGRPPHVLTPDQLSWLVNGTTRGSQVQTRPGLNRRVLKFLDADGSTDAALQAAFESDGRWQGASGYEAVNGSIQLVASIGGRIYVIDKAGLTVQDLTPLAGGNNPNGSQAWFCQAEQFLVIQNGEDIPLIYDGATVRRAVPYAQGGTEVPVGTVMAYNNGRLWVAIPESSSTDSHAFVAGDLAYAGATGTTADLLSFTENTFLAGGGQFVLSSQAGPIRAMCSVAAQDSVTGQGPLQVFTTRGAFSINAPFDRMQWQTTQSPIESISLLAAGAVAQTSTVNVNGDIWFRSPDGVRSFMIARREHGTWVNTPVSSEMTRIFNYDSPALLGFASAALFDNRWLVTASPELVVADGSIRAIAHRAFGVLDFYPVSGMASSLSGSTAMPNWDGIWTGLRVLQIIVVGSDNPRCFVFAIDSENKIRLWEQSKADRFDAGSTAIEWALETPAYGFDTGGWNLRNLAYGDVWLTRLAGTFDMTVRYRCDSDPTWRDWAVGQFCAKDEDCAKAACVTPVRYAEQYRARQRLPEPAYVCDTITDKPTKNGYRFSARLELSGFAAIPQFRLLGEDLPEESIGACPPTSCTQLTLAADCSVNDLAYSID